MLFRILREGFGHGGPAATRQTGFIARVFYGLGLGAALVWLFIMYWALLLDHGRAVYSIFDKGYALPEVEEARDALAVLERQSEALEAKKAALEARQQALATPTQAEAQATPDWRQFVPKGHMVVNDPDRMRRLQKEMKAWGRRKAREEGLYEGFSRAEAEEYAVNMFHPTMSTNSFFECERSGGHWCGKEGDARLLSGQKDRENYEKDRASSAGIPEPTKPFDYLASWVHGSAEERESVCRDIDGRLVRCNWDYKTFLTYGGVDVFHAKGFVTREAMEAKAATAQAKAIAKPAKAAEKAAKVVAAKYEDIAGRVSEIDGRMTALLEGAVQPDFRALKKSYQRDAVLFFGLGGAMVLFFWLLISMPRYGLVAGRRGGQVFTEDFRQSFGKEGRKEFRDWLRNAPVLEKVFVLGIWFFIILAAWGLLIFVLMVAEKALLEKSAVIGAAALTFSVPALMIFGPAAVFTAWEYVKEIPWYRDKFILPRGPAARWGGILAFIRHDIGGFFPANAFKIAEQDRSTIYLGRTFAEQDPRLGVRQIGFRSEQHMMSVALTGAGKSRDSIWNTLLSWSGGVFVFDPKGEHMQCTYERRSRYRPAFALDPYRMAPHIAETAHYNPLDEIDSASPMAGADIVNVVQASLYIEKSEGANTAHFRENAQTVLKGFIAHILTRYPAHQRNLPAVCDVLATGAVDDSEDEDTYNIKAVEKVLEEMRGNRSIAKAPMWAMKTLDDVSPKEAGGYLSTIYRGIKWVNDPPVRRTLISSDFKMGELKSKEISVYVVLPRPRIAEQIRWVRTLTTLAMNRCERTAQPEGSGRKVLMLLDEFPQLGTFKPIQSGLVTVRSAGIKLWVVFQNIGALRELYENAHDFFSSCDQQYFGVHATDDATTEHISKALGRYLREHREGRVGETHHQEHVRDLLSPDAVAQFLTSSGSNQIVFPAADALPLKLARVPFDKNCENGSYGHVRDLDENLTQEHIDAELGEIRRPIAEEREKERVAAEKEARETAERAKKAAREEAQRRAEEQTRDATEKRAFYDDMELEPEPVAQEAQTEQPERPQAEKRSAGVFWLFGEEIHLAPAPEPEEVAAFQDEGRGPSRAKARYKPKQEAARVRWSLDVGYTEPQVHDRAPLMYQHAGADEVDKVTEEYNLLLEAAAD